MTVYDLLFLACVTAAVITLMMAAAAAMRGRRAHAVTILKRLGAAGAAYLLLVIFVAAAAPQRVLAIGDPWCFDDWCLTVEGVERVPAAASVAYLVSLRIFSRARGVSQRARGAWVY